METNCYDGPHAAENPQKKTDDLARNVIEQIADKWTILVIDALGTHGEMRFSRLRDEVGGVSQKMLTKTLRQLERDGLVTRYVHPVIPPRVDYQLTPLGRSLLDKICGIWDWVEAHMTEMESARRQFDLGETRTDRAPSNRDGESGPETRLE
ncbi:MULTISPECIES: winged helix-turn-helix transcriptional regulator [Paraburkholderia]|uniref:winged helix-turn-helix transcriptional regulator n=1 Tax=Paraburkholderia TaxID=1822464 RepID=UPI000361E384|nr:MULTISPECIES: helix-turn-helix domain-containing protein [Paraburkholderia]MDH6146980.1 DNA-binding HxlR family transcriptional regulator [Paraburkholderia sp. WSM4179]